MTDAGMLVSCSSLSQCLTLLCKEWDTIEAAARNSVHDARCRLLQAQTKKLEELWLLLEDCCQRVSEQTGIEVPFMDIICGELLKAADISPVLSLNQEDVDAKLREVRAKLNKKGGDPLRDFRCAATELLPGARARNSDWESRCTAVITVLNRVWPKVAKKHDDALAELEKASTWLRIVREVTRPLRRRTSAAPQ